MSDDETLIEQFHCSLVAGNSEKLVLVCEQAAKTGVSLRAPERVLTGEETAGLSQEELKFLFTSIANGDYEASKKYSNTAICSWHGRTPLMCAAENGHLHLVKLFLLQIGCVLGDISRLTALQLALINRHSELLMYLLPESDIRGVYNRTMLHIVASIGLSTYLNNFKAHVGEVDKHGNTALMLAAMNGYKACIGELLIEQGETNENGDTALLLAMRARKHDCIKLLEGEIGISGVTSLMYTASLGNESILSHFLTEKKAAALMGRQDNQGRTSLMYAMESGIAIDISKPLLNKEENIPATDGTLPVYIALKRGLSDYLRILRHQLIIPNNAGDYPLSIAARYCWCDSIIELLDLKENDDTDSLPIHLKPEILGVAIDAAISSRSRLVLPILITHVIKYNLLGAVSIQKRAGVSVLSPTYLMKSAEQGNIHGVLANLHQLNCIYENKTALMLAAAAGHHECVKILLCELGIVSSDGLTALDYACEHGHLSCIKQLSPEYSLMQGKPLYHAAIGNCELIKHTNFVYRSPILSRTPLMCAAACGQDKIITELTEQLCLADKMGYTALGIAVQRDQTSVIPALTAELFLPQENNMSVLMIACKYGCYNAAEALFSLYYSNMKTESIVNGSTKQTPEDIKSDQDGKTALMYATIANKRLLVRMLIGVEGGLQDNSGMTALMYAARYGCKECYETLVACKAETKKHNNNKETALILAIKYKRDLAVRLLGPIEGGEKDQQEETSKTALIFATEKNRKRYIKELRPYGEGLINKYGDSALSIAIRNGLVTITQCLVSSPSERATVKGIITSLQNSATNTERTKECLRIFAEYTNS